MDFLKNNKALIAVILPILILVLLKSSGVNHFKSNSKKWAEPSFKRSNIVYGDQLDSLPGEKLIINLGEGNYEQIS
jgi:predicted AlkP superfamily pyrophosphatase or phosphodiesterase